MADDPTLAKRLEDYLARRVGFAEPASEVVQCKLRANPSKLARQDEGEPQESAIFGGASISAGESDVEMQTIHVGKRPLEPGGDDDMVCGLDVCDELDECNVYVNDCAENNADEVNGVTLLRDDVAKARM